MQRQGRRCALQSWGPDHRVSSLFIHREQLAYQLTPELYSSPEHYQCELEQILRPAWHLAGVVSELPRSGDFKTFELLGTPVQLRNFDGTIHAYLNVCSHRHCLLTDHPSGHSPRLICQYHGWEYNESGNVAKVPDGGCFKPFDRENSKLTKFRVALCGQLIFLSLTDNGPTLREHLGPSYDMLQERTALPWSVNWTWTNEFDCNWKIPVENTVETYHLPYIHKKTFDGIYPAEADQTHELHDGYTSLVFRLDPSNGMIAMQGRACRALGGEAQNTYVHFVAHPNLVFTFTDLFTHAQEYVPTSPTTSMTRVWMFSRGTDRRKLRPQIIKRVVAWVGRRKNEAIQLEDASVFADQQRGVEVSPHPGCIGTREERIYMFHRYLLTNVKSPIAPQPAEPTSPALEDHHRGQSATHVDEPSTAGDASGNGSLG